MTEYSVAAPAGFFHARQKLAVRLLGGVLGALRYGRLTIVWPSGQTMVAAGPCAGPEAEWRLNNFRALRRILTKGDIGLAEGFVAGDWATPDLTALLRLAARNAPHFSQKAWGGPLHRLWNRLRHGARKNSRAGSRRNIFDHYDLGNEFFAAWLDPSMLYSSGLFEGGATTLSQAQAQKLDAIADWLDAPAGADILEIGCGWGALAERLARDGARKIVGLTLSPAQLGFASNRLARQNLDAGVELNLLDYRDVQGRFDRVVSIEMIEAVGEAFWPVYFQTIAERLKPGGKALIQAITIEQARFAAYRARPDFIQRHIFPGGFLPTPEAIAHEAAQAGLKLTARKNFGLSYAETLVAWRENFVEAWPKISALGFEPRFKRLWLYYLSYCEAGFREQATDVGFYLFEKAEASA